MQLTYRPDIDGLRALAILSVVLFHAFPRHIPGGFIGVDVFFVISGFLISGILFKGINSNTFILWKFYSNRIRRLFPALLSMMLIVYMLGWFLLTPSEFAQLGKHMMAGIGFSENLVLLSEAGYFDNSSELKPLMHLWSLGVEEQFYILYPLLLLLLVRIRIHFIWPLAVLCAAFFTLNLVVSFYLDLLDHAFFLPFTRFWELLAGSLLACIEKNSDSSCFRKKSISADIIACCGIIFLCYASFFISSAEAYPGWKVIIPVLGAASVIYAGPNARVNQWLLTNKLMIFLGLISYPLYLWHWPLLSFFRITHIVNDSQPIRLLLVMASFLLAYMTWRFIEKPIRSGKFVSSKIVIWLLIIGISIAAIGYQTYASNGVPQRLDSNGNNARRAVALFHYEFTKDARANDCWLSIQQPADAFKSQCLGGIDDNTSDKKSILLWGDSHAARLYPGLINTLGSGYRIAQLTRSSCPPFLDYGVPICAANNLYVLSQIRKYHPQQVVLFGVWGNYHIPGHDIMPDFLRTIEAIEKAGVRKIIVIGPAPRWKTDLPKIYLRNNNFLSEQPSGKMKTGLVMSIHHLDSILGDSFSKMKNANVKYFSVIQLMCDNTGCLTHASNDPTSFITWDYGHLTTQGAEILARELPIE